MLLVLTGEVSVQTADAGTGEPVVISVLGPGNVIGAMGLLDGRATLGHLRGPPAASRQRCCRAVRLTS